MQLRIVDAQRRREAGLRADVRRYIDEIKIDGMFIGGLVVFAIGVGVLVVRSLMLAPKLGLAFDGGGALRFGLNASVVATALALLASPAGR